MLNKIIDAISIKINSVYPEGYSIYTEAVEQGFLAPCFFIKLLSSAQIRQSEFRFLCKHKFDIQYYSKGPNKNEELLDVVDKLGDALEFITDTSGDVYLGSNIGHESIDGILHFYISFDFCIFKVEEVAESMENLETRFN